MQPQRPAFTLIELLVVLTIFGVMTALVLAAVQRGRESARRLQCQARLAQVGLALLNYHDRCRSFPPGYGSAVDAAGADIGPGWGWAAFLLNDLEEDSLARRIAFDLPVQDPANFVSAVTVVRRFRCPSDPSPDTFTIPCKVTDPDATVVKAAMALKTALCPAGTCTFAHANYVGVFGSLEITSNRGAGNGVFYRNSKTGLLEITDGTSNTLLIGERATNLAMATWTGAATGALVYPVELAGYPPSGAPALVLGHTGTADEAHTPNNGQLHADDFSSRHLQGANFTFCDGSVRFLSERIDPVVWESLGTRAGGESIAGSDF